MPGTSHSTFNMDAYCKRVGYTGPLLPTLATLNALHKLHPAAITFEAIDVLLNRGVDITPAAVDRKLITLGRGGYCFEQNNLFKRVLLALGFEVETLLARVLWSASASTPIPARTHMVLKVTIAGSAWLADVGFGACVPTQALCLGNTEPQTTSHESYRVKPGARGFLLEALLDKTWAPVYEFSLEPQLDVDLLQANWFTSTHPSSRFRQHLIVARTTTTARYGLLDNRLTIRRTGEPLEQKFLTAEEITQVLAEVFHLNPEPAWSQIIANAAATGLTQLP